jgi:single-strand DNA-binding protein
MNKVVLIGRLTRDPELKFVAGSGTAVATFCLAVDRSFKNKEGVKETDFINCVMYGKRAENLANYQNKGKLLAVSGRIQTRTYEGNDGQKKYYTEVVCDDDQFLEYSKSGSQGAQQQQGFGGGFNDTGFDDGFYPADGDNDIPF